MRIQLIFIQLLILSGCVSISKEIKSYDGYKESLVESNYNFESNVEVYAYIKGNIACLTDRQLKLIKNIAREEMNGKNSEKLKIILDADTDMNFASRGLNLALSIVSFSVFPLYTEKYYSIIVQREANGEIMYNSSMLDNETLLSLLALPWAFGKKPSDILTENFKASLRNSIHNTNLPFMAHAKNRIEQIQKRQDRSKFVCENLRQEIGSQLEW